MFTWCCFACPTCCHPNGRTLPHRLGRTGPPPPSYCRVGMEVGFAPQPSWGRVGTEDRFVYSPGCVSNAGEGCRQGPAHRLGLRGSCCYFRSGWGWESGSDPQAQPSGGYQFPPQHGDGKQNSAQTHRREMQPRYCGGTVCVGGKQGSTDRGLLRVQSSQGRGGVRLFSQRSPGEWKGWLRDFCSTELCFSQGFSQGEQAFIGILFRLCLLAFKGCEFF